jgi:hypothetical protein
MRQVLRNQHVAGVLPVDRQIAAGAAVIAGLRANSTCLRFIDRHVTQGEKRPAAPSILAIRQPGRRPRRRIDFLGLSRDTDEMGVRTRGLDIKAGASKFKADQVAREEAEAVVDRWNRRLATGRDML